MSTDLSDELNSASGIFNRDVILDDLVCSICFDYFNNPKTLACQHTFCHLCIEPLVIDSQISCPLCRVQVKCEDLNSIPKNTLLANLIENLKNAKAECPKCKKVQFLQLCSHCSKVLCKNCKEDHLKSTIDELKSQYVEYLNSKEQIMKTFKITAKKLQQEAIDETFQSVIQLEKQIQLIFQVKKLSLISDIKKFYENKLSEMSQNLEENINKCRKDFDDVIIKYEKDTYLNKDMKYIHQLNSMNKNLKELVTKNQMENHKIHLNEEKYNSSEYKIYTDLIDTLRLIDSEDNEMIQKDTDFLKNIEDDNKLAQNLNLSIVYKSNSKNIKVTSLAQEKNLNDLKSNIERLISNAKLFLSKQTTKTNNEFTSDELNNLKKDNINLLKATNYAQLMSTKYKDLKIEINDEKSIIYFQGLQNDIFEAQKDAEKILNDTKSKKYEFDAMKLKFLDLNSKFIKDWLLTNNLDCVIDAHTEPNNLIIYSISNENIDRCYEMLNDEIIVKKHSLADDSKIKEYLIHLLKATINNNETIETILFQHFFIKQVNSNEFCICGFKSETRKAYFEAIKGDSVDLTCLDI